MPDTSPRGSSRTLSTEQAYILETLIDPLAPAIQQHGTRLASASFRLGSEILPADTVKSLVASQFIAPVGRPAADVTSLDITDLGRLVYEEYAERQAAQQPAPKRPARPAPAPKKKARPAKGGGTTHREPVRFGKLLKQRVVENVVEGKGGKRSGTVIIKHVSYKVTWNAADKVWEVAK